MILLVTRIAAFVPCWAITSSKWICSSKICILLDYCFHISNPPVCLPRLFRLLMFLLILLLILACCFWMAAGGFVTDILQYLLLLHLCFTSSVFESVLEPSLKLDKSLVLSGGLNLCGRIISFLYCLWQPHREFGHGGCLETNLDKNNSSYWALSNRSWSHEIFLLHLVFFNQIRVTQVSY